MTDQATLSTHNRKNVVDYGADPTGKQDASAAFQKMADDSAVSAIIVPDGIFKLDKKIDLKMKNLLGPGKGRYNQATRNISHITTGALKGENDYLFTNQGAEFDGLTFCNLGSGGVLDGYSYNARVSNCYFESLGTAIYEEEAFVNFRLEFCNFASCAYGVRQGKKGALNTTFHMIGCEFNTTGNGAVFAGQLYGANFRDNIFEQMTGDAIKASHIYECNFIGNWWEGHNGHDKAKYPNGYPCIDVTEGQQMLNNVAAANHVSENWLNLFNLDEEGRNGGGMGGVSMNNGKLRVIASPGRAVHITPDGIRASRADWIGNDPFVIEAGCSRAPWWAQALALRTGGGDVVFDNYPTKSDGGVFVGALKFLKAASVSGEGSTRKVENQRYESLRLFRDSRQRPMPGMTGKSELSDGCVATTGVPVKVYCRNDNYQVGQEAFKKIDRSKKGEVTFEGPYSFDRTTLQVTVEDRGVICDGVSWDNGDGNYDGSVRWSNRMTIHFADRKSGEAVTPKGFWLSFNTHPKG